MSAANSNQNLGLPGADSRELLSSAKLAELLREIAPGETLEPQVEQFLKEHAEEFVESVTEFACKLAKHRNSRTLDARDVQMHLETTWDIRVPGYGDDPLPARRPQSNAVHLQRLQQVQKAQQQLANNQLAPQANSDQNAGAKSSNAS